MSRTGNTDLSGNFDHFSPRDYLIGIAMDVRRDRRPVIVRHPHHGALSIHPAANCYLPGGAANMAALCAAPASEFQVIALTEPENNRLLREGTRRDLDELMWIAAFHASAGRLIEGTAAEVAMLDRIPNLTQVPHTENALRILAFFAKHPASIHVARQALKVDAREIAQICSAARCAGALRPVNTIGTINAGNGAAATARAPSGKPR